MIGQTVREARKNKGLSQEELGRRIGRSRITVSRYERGESKPSEDALAELADELDLDVESLRDEIEEGRRAREAETPDYVSHEDHIPRWRNAVLSADVDRDVRTLLMSLGLPEMLDPGWWVVSTTPGHFADVTNNPLPFVREHWSGMLESPFVERIGEGEWVFALRFPDE
jgi:transcriptional regulator with XRE-family HTH domain